MICIVLSQRWSGASMPSRDRPPASTVPAASASASRARWAAEGFSSPTGQHGGQQGQRGIGDGDEVPGQAVGGVVRWRRRRGRGGGRASSGDQRFRCRSRARARASKPRSAALRSEGPGAGVGVPDAEEGVALPLDEVIAGDPGPVVGGGVQQGPASGVAAEGEGVGGGGHGADGDVEAGGEGAGRREPRRATDVHATVRRCRLPHGRHPQRWRPQHRRPHHCRPGRGRTPTPARAGRRT